MPSVLCCLYMWFLLQVCVYMYVHVCMYTHTHISMTRLLNCQVLKFDFDNKDEVCLFYKGFVLWQLLAKTRWKLFKQELWAQFFPASCKTVRGQKPEIFHIALRIYVKKKNLFSSPSPGFMKLTLAAPSHVNVAIFLCSPST